MKNTIEIEKSTKGFVDSKQPKSTKSGLGNQSAISETPDTQWENKQYLLKFIMKHCKITNEDLKNTSLVKSKVRESKIETLLAS